MDLNRTAQVTRGGLYPGFHSFFSKTGNEDLMHDWCSGQQPDYDTDFTLVKVDNVTTGYGERRSITVLRQNKFIYLVGSEYVKIQEMQFTFQNIWI